jgi:hypothetical protein
MKKNWYRSEHIKIDLAKELIFCIVGITIGYIVQSKFPVTATFIYIAATSFLALITILLYWLINQIIETRKLLAARSYSVTLGMGKNAFDHCKSAVRQVQQSVDVVGPFFGNPQMYVTDQHDDYLVEGVDGAIERHQLDEVEDSIFSYFRIVQLNSTDAVKKGKIGAAQIGNSGLAKHIWELLEVQKKSPKISIDIRGIGHVESFPSTLVVDNRYVFFSIPTTQEGDGRLHMDLVIGIEDQTGFLPSQMRKVIRHLKTVSVEINEVDSMHEGQIPVRTDNPAILQTTSNSETETVKRTE